MPELESMNGVEGKDFAQNENNELSPEDQLNQERIDQEKALLSELKGLGREGYLDLTSNIAINIAEIGRKDDVRENAKKNLAQYMAGSDEEIRKDIDEAALKLRGCYRKPNVKSEIPAVEIYAKPPFEHAQVWSLDTYENGNEFGHGFSIPSKLWQTIKNELTPEELHGLEVIKFKQSLDKSISQFQAAKKTFNELDIDAENPQIFEEQ